MQQKKVIFLYIGIFIILIFSFVNVAIQSQKQMEKQLENKGVHLIKTLTQLGKKYFKTYEEELAVYVKNVRKNRDIAQEMRERGAVPKEEYQIKMSQGIKEGKQLFENWQNFQKELWKSLDQKLKDISKNYDQNTTRYTLHSVFIDLRRTGKKGEQKSKDVPHMVNATSTPLKQDPKCQKIMGKLFLSKNKYTKACSFQKPIKLSKDLKKKGFSATAIVFFTIYQ